MHNMHNMLNMQNMWNMQNMLFRNSICTICRMGLYANKCGKTKFSMQTPHTYFHMHPNNFIINFRSREVKAGIACSSGAGRRGFDPHQLQRTTRAFFPPLAI